MNAHHVIRHSVDFSILGVVIVFGLYGLYLFRFEVASQIAVSVLMSILYVFWGIFHHYHDGNLTGKVVLEYIAVASLVAFILILFLLRV